MQKQVRTCFVGHMQPIMLLWVTAVTILFALLIWHDKSGVRLTTAADDFQSLPDSNPIDSSQLQSPKWHIELFVHPQCPCTRATLKLVDRLHRELLVPPELTIYVASYDQIKSDWSSSPNLRLAQQLDQAVVMEDKEANRAKSLGVKASGTLVVTDGEGNRLFAGGITAGRSCEQLNPSYFSVRNLLNNPATGLSNTVVYGCDL